MCNKRPKLSKNYYVYFYIFEKFYPIPSLNRPRFQLNWELNYDEFGFGYFDIILRPINVNFMKYKLRLRFGLIDSIYTLFR